MGNAEINFFRSQLLDRRQRLKSAGAELAGGEDLSELLQEVDSALARTDQGTYGPRGACTIRSSQSGFCPTL